MINLSIVIRCNCNKTINLMMMMMIIVAKSHKELCTGRQSLLAQKARPIIMMHTNTYIAMINTVIKANKQFLMRKILTIACTPLRNLTIKFNGQHFRPFVLEYIRSTGNYGKGKLYWITYTSLCYI